MQHVTVKKHPELVRLAAPGEDLSQFLQVWLDPYCFFSNTVPGALFLSMEPAVATSCYL